MDKEAVVAVMCDAGHDAWTESSNSWGPVLWNEIMRGALNGLGANGYVVVPRHEWERFLAQADFMAIRSQEGTYAKRQYNLARAAVVEAVGPTREDTK